MRYLAPAFGPTFKLQMKAGTDVLVRIAYAENFIENGSFPQPNLFIDGSRGSLELAQGRWLRITTEKGTYDWGRYI